MTGNPVKSALALPFPPLFDNSDKMEGPEVPPVSSDKVSPLDPLLPLLGLEEEAEEPDLEIESGNSSPPLPTP